MTANEALAFIHRHGVVLVSARGPVPRMTEAIAGEPVKGSWWGHPKGREIFQVLQSIDDSRDVLCCRLIGGKLTLVHRRLWPALVRMAQRFPAGALAQVRQEHTVAGHHLNRETPFPQWVPPEVMQQAHSLSEHEATKALGPALPPSGNTVG